MSDTPAQVTPPQNGNLYRNCVSGKHGAQITSHIASVVNTEHNRLRHISLPWWVRRTPDYVTYSFCGEHRALPITSHIASVIPSPTTMKEEVVKCDARWPWSLKRWSPSLLLCMGFSSPYTFCRLGEREVQVNREWHFHLLHIYKEVVIYHVRTWEFNTIPLWTVLLLSMFTLPLQQHRLAILLIPSLPVLSHMELYFQNKYNNFTNVQYVTNNCANIICQLIYQDMLQQHIIRTGW